MCWALPALVKKTIKAWSVFCERWEQGSKMFDILLCVYHHLISLMTLFVIHHTDIISHPNCFTFYYVQVGVMEPVQFQSSWLCGCGFWRNTKEKGWESGKALLTFMWKWFSPVGEGGLEGGVNTLYLALKPWHVPKNERPVCKWESGRWMWRAAATLST